ncbi:MAG: flagellar motor switch protein FliN [Gemmatimonadetes bacterium]|nr:flagellar motor switch protein FliN [Gemmatimonadota bacterium]
MTDSHRDVDTLDSQFSAFEATEDAAAPASLSVLHDLTMPVAIELGRTRMSVQEILALGRGSVIQLERLAGEPIDVFVGDRRFAEGEVVVVGEQFGVRVTRVLHSGRSDGEAAA